MAEGIMVCGGFLTKRVLTIARFLLMLVLLIGCICLGVGMGKYCSEFDYYDGYDEACRISKLYLTIDGGILIGLSLIGLIMAAVVFYKMNDVSEGVAPNNVTQPCTVVPVHGHPTVAYPNTAAYAIASPGHPQQPTFIAYTSAGVNQGDFKENPINDPQHPEPAQSRTEPQTSEPNM